MTRSEYMSDYLAKRKMRHICAICGQVDERTKGGKSLCAACAAERALADKLRYPARAEKMKAEQKGRYERRKAEHRCADCGRQLPEERKTKTCLDCAVKRADRAAKRKKEAVINERKE